MGFFDEPAHLINDAVVAMRVSGGCLPSGGSYKLVWPSHATERDIECMKAFIYLQIANLEKWAADSDENRRNKWWDDLIASAGKAGG